MTRRHYLLSLSSAMFASSAVLLHAHDEYRVVGVVTKMTATSVEVKNKEGKDYSIQVNKQTAVTRNDQAVATSELKAGLTVVVDALGDSESDLTAVSIRIVPGQ